MYIIQIRCQKLATETGLIRKKISTASAFSLRTLTSTDRLCLVLEIGLVYPKSWNILDTIATLARLGRKTYILRYLRSTTLVDKTIGLQYFPCSNSRPFCRYRHALQNSIDFSDGTVIENIKSTTFSVAVLVLVLVF